MVLKLDPRYPILWRTPSSVQVGSEAAAVLEEVSDGDARLLAALAAGVSESGYAMIARTAHVSPERAEGILSSLSPVLAAPRATPSAVAAVMGDSALARDLAGLLSASGALGDPAQASVVVLVAGAVIAPADHLRWLNRDVVHVPVLAAEQSVEVGPFVVPGAGPCLYCVQLARTDDDPAWPAVATQLLGRPAPEPDPLARAEVAVFASRRVLDQLAGVGMGDSDDRMPSARSGDTWAVRAIIA